MTPAPDRAHYRALAQAAMFRTWKREEPLRGHRRTIEPISRGRRLGNA